jgi:hypothetical protein
MPDEIKYRIIKGRGEEEEKGLKTSKEIFTKSEKIEPTNIPPENLPPTFKIKEKEVVPEPVPEIQPIETPKPAEHELLKVQTPLVQKPKPEISIIKLPQIQIPVKSNKKILALLLIVILIPSLLYGGFLFFSKSNILSKFSTKQLTKEPEVKSETPKITSIFRTTPSTSTISTSSLPESTTSQPTTSQISLNESTSSTSTLLTTTSLISSISTFTPTTSSHSALSTSSKPTSSTTSLSFTTPTKTETKEIVLAQEEKLEKPSPKPEEIKEVKIEDIGKQGTKVVFPYLQLPEINISLDELTTNNFRLKWLELMRIQKSAGSLYKINFLYNNQPLPAEFIKNYFFTPSFIEKKYQESFKNSLGDSYLILIYYTYTRKFPVIIFTIKDENVVVPFMRLWDKESLLNDFKKIYLGLSQGELLRFYTITEEYEGIKYKIAYYNNNYKFIWTIYNNNLIISTSLNAFKYVIKNLK